MKLSSAAITAAIQRGIAPTDPRFAPFVEKFEAARHIEDSKLRLRGVLQGAKVTGVWSSLEEYTRKTGVISYAIRSPGIQSVRVWERGRFSFLELEFSNDRSRLYDILPKGFRRIL